jgi:hypothetical protein
MLKSEIEDFARDFFNAADEFVGQSPEKFTLTLGRKTVEVYLNEIDGLSQHIKNAFFPVISERSDFSLTIWRSNTRAELPSLDWARNYLTHDILLPIAITFPYRVAFDKSQGFIFLYDTTTKRGAIWVAEDSKISLNSFVTPFRMIFSWMAESFGGELIHASAISKNGNGVIINGPSGSGKSTLALLCALAGFNFIADDVVLYHDRLIYALYRYAKVNGENSPCDLSGFNLFQMTQTKDAKKILDLTQLGEKFVSSSIANAVVLPIFAHLNQHARIPPSIAIQLLAPNSLRELMGGTPYNFKNLVDLTRAIPAYRIALSKDNLKNVETVVSIFAELS